MKKNFEWNLTTASLSAIVFYAVCGLLLILLPEQALAIANYGIAALLAVAGIICVINYMRDSVLAGMLGIRLALGLVLICFSVLMFCYPTFLATILPAIWGLSMLAGGFGKVQMAVDLKRIGDKRWWVMLIGAAVSFVLGVMCLANPIYIAQTIFLFIGICLVAEAALDLAAYLMIRVRIRQYRKAMSEAEKTIEI
ncbi:MAG: DUF308 domain-containing protein [Eubacteriales bacterium]|nr:DUF308 domain-containing protein [Eubacteriales bacterium]